MRRARRLPERARLGGQRVATVPEALRGVWVEADEGRFVVEGALAVAPDGRGVAPPGPGRVVAHLGGAAPEREGRDQPRRTGEGRRMEQRRLGDHLPLGGAAGGGGRGAAP